MSSAHSVFTHLIVLSIHARAGQFNCSESLRTGGRSGGRPKVRPAGRGNPPDAYAIKHGTAANPRQAAFTSFSTAEITDSSRLQNEKRTK